MTFRSKYLAALIALAFIGLGLVSGQGYAAATIDRAVCSTADKSGGDAAVCSGQELIDSATQEVAKLYQGNILVVNSVSGTNTITGSTSPVATALVDGEMRQLKPANTNTGAATYNDNGLGAKQLVSVSGSALTSGDLQSSSIYILRYYAANDEWRVLSPLGTGGGAPSTPSYVTMDLNASLASERVLTEGTNGIDISDGGANGNVTLNFDPTEVSNVTWGAGSLTNWTFNSTGTADPSFSIFNQGMTLYNSDNSAATFFIGGQGRLGLVEANANGSDSLYLQAPSSITTSQTCTLENDANFIPDSCVGNGTDDGLISTQVDTSAEIAAIVGDETGTNKLVFSDSPVLVTPNLGTPSAVNLSNGTALPISGINGLGTGVGTWLATPSSANLASAVTGETGSGALVFDTSPTLTTPNLGTPSAVNLSNGTALPISGINGLGTGVGTWLGTPSSSNLAAAVTGETGSGALVFGTSPTFTTNVTLGSDTISDFTGIGLALSTGVLGLDVSGATDEFCLTYESTGPTIQWQTCGGGGGGGSPGGSSGQIQWNNAGSFDGFTMGGDVTVDTSTGTATIAANSVALGTDTTGNYAAGDAEAGAALTGDSATAFFSAGTIELARGGTGASLSDPNADRLTFWDDSAGAIDWLTLGSAYATTTTTLRSPRESFCVAASDESTAITTGTAKVTFRMPYAFTLTDIRGSLNTVSSSGSPVIDVNEAGTTVMSTNKVLIDVSEKTSTTAVTAVGITDTSLADDAEMTIDVDTAGTGAKGLKICLIGYQT